MGLRLKLGRLVYLSGHALEAVAAGSLSDRAAPEIPQFAQLHNYLLLACPGVSGYGLQHVSQRSELQSQRSEPRRGPSQTKLEFLLYAYMGPNPRPGGLRFDTPALE